MYFAKLPRLAHSLAVRLTIWYAAIFAASSALAFGVVYALVAGSVAERTDEEMLQDFDEYANHWRQEGIERIAKEMRFDTQGSDARRYYSRLWGADGRELVATDLSSWPELERVSYRVLPVGDMEPQFDTHEIESNPAPMRILIGGIGQGVSLEIGRSLEDEEEFQRQLLRGFLLSLAIVLLLGGPIGWFMARRALHGVNEVTRTAKEISEGALDRRVPLAAAGDELDRLARTFNAMLDRIQSLVIGMRDMADNLAHDLRSPLGRIRACAEMSLVSAETSGAGEPWAVNTIEECDRLLEMLNTTLDIAEADSGAARLNLGSVDLAEMVLTACELFQAVAEDRQIGIATSVCEPCWIEGDRQRLQRVIANLLDNALKYTPSGGEVRIALREQAQRVVLTFEDTGIGIAADDLQRIFQRFYRCDPSRSRPGIGLGLSLALAFVRAHGGDVTVTSTPGKGSTFTVVLSRPAHALSVQGASSGTALAAST
jgi:signal transduction histidine kinase